MTKQIELERLDRAIKDSEIRLRTANTQIDSLTREIDTLTILESELVENVKFLKQQKIIASADKYKKSKEDLAKTVIRMISLKNDREGLRKAANKIEKLMQDIKEKIENIKNDGNNNVIQGKFGRKEDGQG